MAQKALHIEAVNLQKKNAKFFWSGLLFVFLGAGLVGGVFWYLYLDGAYDEGKDSGMWGIMPILLLFIPGYGYTLLRQALVERKLFSKTDLNGLYLDKKGIGGPMLLLEGVFRERLRKARKPEFYLLWESIENFILEPVRGSMTYGSPPYYKVTFKGKTEKANASCFILRQYFEEREDEILKVVKEHLGADHIVNNDPKKED